MFDNQSFGHFGAPETLSHDYGAEATRPNGQSISFGSDQQYSEPPPYIRNGKALPNLKGGATDTMVQDSRGILGLVSEVQRRMKLQDKLGAWDLINGVLTTGEIKMYQAQNDLTQDGIIGPKTYAKLGFKPPFGSRSTSASTTLDISGASATAIGGKPWYKSTWFLGTVTVVALGAGAYLLYPKGE